MIFLMGEGETGPRRAREFMNTSNLMRVPLFRSLPVNEASELVNAFHYRSYAEGEMLFAEGDPAGTFAIVLSGKVEVIKAQGTPEEMLLAVIEPGEYLGEMSLLQPEATRTAGARARTQVGMIEMTREDFEALVLRRPGVAVELVREVTSRLRGAEDMAIRALEVKNRQLAEAYEELKAAQAQIIEQEVLRRELDIAHRIQAGLLPRTLPKVPGQVIAAHWKPARFVGGDFYDFIEHADGRLGIVVGDVSGKGVPAALVMATTRAVLRPAAVKLASPGAVLEEVNRLLVPDMPRSMFVTCLYLLLDPATGALEFANAGHNLPFHCSERGVEELRAVGMPLGLMPGMDYAQGEAVVGPGESLVLVSDGVTEAHSPEGEMFGTPRLREVLEACRGVDAVPEVLKALAAFTGEGWEQEDDVTLISVEVTVTG